MLVRWSPPPEDVVMINVDGSSLGNPGIAGFGGVIRDHLGQWIMGFSGFIGWATALHVELIAIWQGLSLAHELGYKRVICQSDSMIAVTLILQDAANHCHHMEAIIESIRYLMSLDWQVSIQRTLREGNFVADGLAKRGSLETSSLVIWETCPHWLDNLVKADAIGTFYSRS